MHIGFKTGPRNFDVGKQIVIEHGAKLCEIWFDVTAASQYDDTISWLQQKNVSFGLHHWGTVSGKYKTNLMTGALQIREETIAQIKKTIILAEETGAVYVNAHPGARSIETIDFATSTQSIDTTIPITPEDTALENLLLAAEELHRFAEEHSVILTIETLPRKEAYAEESDRERVYTAHNAPLSAMKKIASAGTYVANDITHTAAQLAEEYNDPTEIWNEVVAFSQEIFSSTRLLHINTVVPPYNGTDSHGGITDEDFASERIPTKAQLIDFLRLFKNRDDVFVIPEPSHDHPDNYLALQRLVESL